MELLKQCTKCQQCFPASPEHFHRDKTKTDGLMPQCKSCRKENAQRYYLENQESILQKNAEWKNNNPDKIAQQVKNWAANNPERRKKTQQEWIKANPHKNTVYMRKWRGTNREQYRKIDRKYRANNRERQRDLARKARANNRERYRNYSRNRNARKRHNGGILTVNDIQLQYVAQDGMCFWCSSPVEQTYHADHVIPLSRGGTNTPDNIVISCPFCNQSKSDKLPYTEWTPSNPL